MASSQAKPMPQTVEAYKKLAQRDLELIEDQRDEIGKLKAKINKLEQKVESKNKWISVDSALPESIADDVYVVYTVGGRMTLDVWDVFKRDFNFNSGNVAYWVNLPNPPKESEG